MSNRAPLLRMIILVIFLIFVLVVSSTQLSNRKTEIMDPPDYNQNFFWQDKDKAYSLLLHSVTLKENSFSAYSAKRDSLMTFPAEEEDIRTIKNKFGGSLYKFQKCTNCHKAE